METEQIQRQKDRDTGKEREPETNRQAARVLRAGFSLTFFLHSSSPHPDATQSH